MKLMVTVCMCTEITDLYIVGVVTNMVDMTTGC